MSDIEAQIKEIVKKTHYYDDDFDIHCDFDHDDAAKEILKLFPNEILLPVVITDEMANELPDSMVIWHSGRWRWSSEVVDLVRVLNKSLSELQEK